MRIDRHRFSGRVEKIESVATRKLQRARRMGLSLLLAEPGEACQRAAALQSTPALPVPRGEFSTWRAVRAVGDYDLNTFLIRADLVGGAEGLQPGLTVRLHRQ
jgi:hypothetical protein